MILNEGNEFVGKKMTHRELCITTAKRFNDKLALYEYNSFASMQERPDVLVYGMGETTLYEIKLSLSDFNAEKKKQARKKYRIPWVVSFWEEKMNLSGKEGRNYIRMKRENPDLFYQEDSHLGTRRFYVCPFGVIPVEKLPEGWGLYYVKGSKFYLQKDSARWRTNLRKENDLLVHAMRRYVSGDNNGILVNTYVLGGRHVNF